MNQIQIMSLREKYKYMKYGIDAAIKRCLEHQQWLLGPAVRSPEITACKYLNNHHCIGFSMEQML